MEEKQKHPSQYEPQIGGQPPAINVNVQNQNVQQQSAVLTGGGGASQIYTKLTMLEVLGHLVIWAIISVLTLGIGTLFWPYAAAKLVLNSIVINNRSIRCDLAVGGQIGHMILWAILIAVTLGLAFPFYVFGVLRTAINASRFL